MLQGPDWNTVPDEQKRTAASRSQHGAAGSDAATAAAASDYLWTPHAADCAVDSDNRPQSTRSAANAHIVMLIPQCSACVHTSMMPAICIAQHHFPGPHVT